VLPERTVERSESALEGRYTSRERFVKGYARGDNGMDGRSPTKSGMTRKVTGMTNSCNLLPVFVGGFREAAEKGETVKVIFQEVDDLPYHIQ
jgi:hypothetical protein